MVYILVVSASVTMATRAKNVIFLCIGVLTLAYTVFVLRRAFVSVILVGLVNFATR